MMNNLHGMPNIVFIYVDDLGWRDAGFMGSEYYETPQIDCLAGEGMVFTAAYANAPNCAPSRACLMTGLYSPRHGIYTVNSSERGPARLRKLIPTPNKTVLSREHQTIAEALQEVGYTCAHLGKWHLGEGEETGPTGRGFDLNIGGGSQGHPASGYFSPYQIDELEDGPVGEYLTDRLTDEALAFIRENRRKPFFLYLAHYAVHTPLEAREEVVARYRRKGGRGEQDNPIYAAMVESVDTCVGRITAELDLLGLRDDTLLVFFSDNGGLGGYREEGIDWPGITSQKPLRGGKGMLYEGGIRVPLIVRWPGRVKPGSSCQTPVSGIDFFPTFLEIVSPGSAARRVLDGESLLPLLSGSGGLEREAIFWHFPVYLEGRGGTWRTTPAGAVRQGDWKLIEFFEEGHYELYNLKDDPGESENLAAKMPGKRAVLSQIMEEWRAELSAPVPTERNPAYQPSSQE